MDRFNRLHKEMKQAKIDSLFITSKANIYYFTNFYTEPHERLVAVYVDLSGNSLLILPEMEKESAIASGWKGDLLPYNDQDNPWHMFEKYLSVSNRSLDSLGIEKDHVTVERYEQITNLFVNANIVDAKETLANLRVVKDKQELDILKQAAAFADLGVKTGIEAIEEGKSELEILAKIEYALKKQGIREMSFSTMVLTGKKTASPHGHPGLEKVSKGDLVLFDLGVIFQGYCSDITRTVAFKTVNEQQRNIYNTVLTAQQKAIEAASIGRPMNHLDYAARNYITEQGYGEYFTHRIGHGIGIDVHEYPSLNATNELPLKAGMSFTIEPGIYVPNIGGVRIEDEIFMSEKGAQLLTNYPKELQIIG
ncbi:M24 family metallopeptidase [Aquibacillus kalidii]|uniref:M24 family metallopeptidase n=1 Tax=Aquibacillus kalidii TaxID=2762597 RepID=UPI001646BDD6|nr:Xaa-Pro peptidase family protein [Aquibacillus kalidii]